MREVTVEALRGEIIRLGALVTQTRVMHACGIRLHGPGSVLAPQNCQAMQEVGIKSVFLLEAGESEQSALRALTTEPVEVFDLAVGDMLAEDLKDPTGRVLFKAGTRIDEVILETGVRGATGTVTVRRREPRGGEEQAKSYLGRIPPAPPRAPRPDSRVTRAMEGSAGSVKVLLAPRARVLVTIADNFQRSLLLNSIAAEGHEVFDRRWVDVSQGDLHQLKLDALILDLAEAPGALAMLRKSDLFSRVGVLVAGAEARKAEIFKAVTAGANGSITLPLRRDLLLEKLRGTMQSLGKRVTVKPALITERRTAPREGGHFVCRLSDPFLKNPLPIHQVTALDLGENGMRIEYVRPAWPLPHAYLGHGVHPQHFCFNYARDNPLGRDLTVTMPPAGGKEMQISAKFVHVSVNSEYETAGLLFHRVKGSVRDHISTVRGQVPSTVRAAAPATTRKAF